MTDKRADGYILLDDFDSEIWIGGLDDKDRVEKILGMEFGTLYFNEISQIPYSSVLTGLTLGASLTQTHSVPDWPDLSALTADPGFDRRNPATLMRRTDRFPP